MLKLTDLADKIAPHLIGISTPFGGALAKNYIGANFDDPGGDTVPTGEDLDKVKADVKGDIDKANTGLNNVKQEINNLKNEMENVGFKVMSHIPDLANGTDLDVSSIKDPRTKITAYTLQQKNGTDEPYIPLDSPVTQTAPLILGVQPTPYQIQVAIRLHDYPSGAIPWYYFRFMPYVEVLSIRVKLGDTITNSYIQQYNDVTGLIYEGMTLPLNSTIAFYNQYSWGNPTYLKTPQSSIASPPARVDYTDPRDGTNYNDTPAMLAIIPYGDWTAIDNNGSWQLSEGSTSGGFYIAVYKGKCICYDLAPFGLKWKKRYSTYPTGFHIGTHGLSVTYVGPDGQHSISYK